jgi:DNA-binding MarR family transcriptional regulator
MKDVNSFLTDDDGGLFDPRVREAMGPFALDADTAALEAAAAVRSAAQAVDRLRARGAEHRGLSTAALDLLIRLNSTAESLAIGELARLAGMTARNVTGLVDTLERDGLAGRVADPQDRRSVRVTITGAGREWVDAFRRPSDLAMAAIFRGFTDTELTQLRHLCLKVVDNVRELRPHS